MLEKCKQENVKLMNEYSELSKKYNPSLIKNLNELRT